MSIDRDALVQILDEECVWDAGEGGFEKAPGGRVADRILALVRPVEGIVLTSEERHVIADALENDLDFWPEDQRAWRRALAARLEEES